MAKTTPDNIFRNDPEFALLGLNATAKMLMDKSVAAEPGDGEADALHMLGILACDAYAVLYDAWAAGNLNGGEQA